MVTSGKKAGKKRTPSKPGTVRINRLENEVRRVLRNESMIVSEERRIESQEQEIRRNQRRECVRERQIESEEASAMDELKKLETIEMQLKDSESALLRKITYHDIIKSSIGAFVGIVGSFAFAFAPDLFLEISLLRAHLLLVFGFIMVIVFVYFSGFRKVREIRNMRLLPLRAMLIYVTALATVLLVFVLFGIIGMYTAAETYKLVSATSILAVLGACAADMIGRE